MKKNLIEKMYCSKHAEYFSYEREIFKEHIRDNGLRILDVGCGTGMLGRFFRNSQGCTVYGIEIDQTAFKLAESNLDAVINADIETVELPYESDFFDVIILGDVIEHLINPVATVKKLERTLKPAGKMYITVPNIRHWKILMDLLFFDRWEYKTWGILDYTHLRFFTRKSINELFRKSNIRVTDINRLIQKYSKSAYLNKFTLGLFAGFLASHTFMTVEKNICEPEG